jgi:hypothetical protein
MWRGFPFFPPAPEKQRAGPVAGRRRRLPSSVPPRAPGTRTPSPHGAPAPTPPHDRRVMRVVDPVRDGKLPNWLVGCFSLGFYRKRCDFGHKG